MEYLSKIMFYTIAHITLRTSKFESDFVKLQLIVSLRAVARSVDVRELCYLSVLGNFDYNWLNLLCAAKPRSKIVHEKYFSHLLA